jgi:hypothetical protein
MFETTILTIQEHFAFRRWQRDVLKRQAFGRPFVDITVRYREKTEPIRQLLEHYKFKKLMRQARRYDVNHPTDPAHWREVKWDPRYFLPCPACSCLYHSHPARTLTELGRSHVIFQINEEKTRRFEVKVRWITKLILPVLGTAAALIAAAYKILH